MSNLDPNGGTRVHTNFCLVEDGKPVRQTPEVLAWRTDGGNRPSDEWLASEGYYGMLLTPPPEVDRQTQSAGIADLAEWDVDTAAGTVTQRWVISDLNAEQQQEATEQEMSSVRTRRLQLLLLSDYTQGLDFSGDRAAWADYRQELRDITSQQGFPWDVQWPTEPGS